MPKTFAELKAYMLENLTNATKIPANKLVTLIDDLLDSVEWEVDNFNESFKGTATTSTNPGTPAAKCWYLASGPGTYTNFGGIVVAQEFATLTWNGSSWVLYEIDITVDMTLYAKKTMDADLNANSHKITNLANATASGDALSYGKMQSELLEVGKNKSVPATCLENSYFHNGNGVIISQSGWFCTGKQAVLPSTQYVYWLNHADGLYNYLHYYDVNGTWLGNHTTLGGTYDVVNKFWTFTTPANCYFVGCNDNIPPTQTFAQFKISLQLEIGAVKTSFEAYALLIKESILKDYTLNTELTAFLSDYQTKAAIELNTVGMSRNIFNKAGVVLNYYVSNSTGNIASASGWKYTGFIPVLPNTQYTISGNHPSYPIWQYTSAQAPISATGGTTFTTAANCYYIAFTVYGGSGIDYTNTVQVELGATATAYIAYGLILKESMFNEYYNTKIVNDVQKKLKVLKNGEYVYIRSAFNSTYDKVEKWRVWRNDSFNNNTINPDVVLLIAKTAGNSATIYNAGTQFKAGTDDGCPSYYNGGYIGGNHGSAFGTNLVMNSHGKTDVDVGSRWRDGNGRYFVLTRVVDANNLWVHGINYGAGDTWTFYYPTGNLTHVLGATHTTTITVASKTDATQLLPAINNLKRNVYLDNGVELTSGTTDDYLYYCSEVDIIHHYNIINIPALIAYLEANIGSTIALAVANSEASSEVNIDYKIISNGATIVNQSWIAKKEIVMTMLGFVQASVPSCTLFSTNKISIPKSLPIVVGARTWDLRTLEDFDTAPTGDLILSSTYWEVPTSPPDRSLIYLFNGSTIKSGFAMGFFHGKGKADTREDYCTNAWSVYTTKKQYPRGIDSKVGTIAAGTAYNFVAYRYVFDISEQTLGGATSAYWVKVGNDLLVYVDFHSANTYSFVKLDLSFTGMSVTVVEKHANVTVHNDIVINGGIEISSSGTNGYAVLKLT